MGFFFSIIVVCLNPGDKLRSTLKSIEEQTFRDFEVIVKDGLSEDGSLEAARKLSEKWEARAAERGLDGMEVGRQEVGRPEAVRSLRILRKKDSGIYDAMNQGAEEAQGEYIYYLNCGDRFYSERVLQEMADFISGERKRNGNGDRPGIYYGNIFERLTGQKIASNPHMDAFGCYRNVPCHQACFYSRELLRAHPFETGYKVRADYEQFLWCFFNKEEKVIFAYQDRMIADYEGGGFSETKENRRISAREHREITGRYMSWGELLKYRLVMALTFSGLRTKLAQNKRTAGIYNRLKEMVYSCRRRG